METLSSTTPAAEASCRDVGGGVTVADGLTLKTTDSGIGSIAHRPTRRSDSGRRRRLVDSHVVNGTSSADDDDDDDDEPASAAESTGVSDVDVALMWHLARSSAIVQVTMLISSRIYYYYSHKQASK